jgi:nitrogen fixation protein FixH
MSAGSEHQTAMRPKGHRFGWQRAWPLWILAAFFGIIFTANGVLVYLANTSWTGLTTEEAYEKGRTYNKQLARNDVQRALGWTVTLQAEPQTTAGPHRIRLNLVVTDKTGQPLTGAGVQALLVRPTHEGYDREISLTEGRTGTYVAFVDLPLPGQWEVRALVSSAGRDFRLVERISVD